MDDKILIVGAGGMAKEMADLVAVLGFEIEAFFTEEGAGILHPASGARIIHDLEAVTSRQAVIAIGNTAARERLAGLLAPRFQLPNLVHPSACVSPAARLGVGVHIMQNVVVSADADVHDGALLNVGTYVAHDCVVGAHSHLAASVQMGGGSSIGRGVMCGTSTVLLPGVTVGDGSVCGAGAVVTRDVPTRSLAVGVPAQVVKSL